MPIRQPSLVDDVIISDERQAQSDLFQALASPLCVSKRPVAATTFEADEPRNGRPDEDSTAVGSATSQPSPLLQLDRVADVRFECRDGAVVPGVSALFAAHSPVFFALFSKRWHMDEVRRLEAVHIPFRGRTFVALKTYVYTMQLRCSLESLVELFAAADHYQLHGLSSLISAYVTGGSLSPAAACGIMASLLDDAEPASASLTESALEAWMRACTDAMLENVSEVFGCKWWPLLPLHVVEQIVAEDNIGALEERDVLAACVCWATAQALPALKALPAPRDRSESPCRHHHHQEDLHQLLAAHAPVEDDDTLPLDLMTDTRAQSHRRALLDDDAQSTRSAATIGSHRTTATRNSSVHIASAGESSAVLSSSSASSSAAPRDAVAVASSTAGGAPLLLQISRALVGVSSRPESADSVVLTASSSMATPETAAYGARPSAPPLASLAASAAAGGPLSSAALADTEADHDSAASTPMAALFATSAGAWRSRSAADSEGLCRLPPLKLSLSPALQSSAAAIKPDPTAVRAALLPLVQHIRLPLLTSEQIARLVVPLGVLEPAALAHLFAYVAVKGDGIPVPAGMCARPRGRPSSIFRKLLVCGGLTGETRNQSVEVVDLATGEVEPGPDIPTALSACTAVTLRDGRILVVGGFDGRHWQKSTFLLERVRRPAAETTPSSALDAPAPRGQAAAPQLGQPSTPPLVGAAAAPPASSPAALFTWVPGPDTLAPRSAAASGVLHDGRVIVAGGATPLRGVEIFSPELGTWVEVTPMSRRRHSCAGVVLTDGRFLVCGGASHGGPLASCEVYDPRLNAWMDTADMHVPRVGAQAALLRDGRVLVTGGSTTEENGVVNSAGRPRPTRTCEIFDPVANTWERAASLNTERSLHALVSLRDGSVLAVGGEGSGDREAGILEVERFEPATGRWLFDDGVHLGRRRKWFCSALLQTRA